MSNTLFVPLVCPTCGNDLAGRASDVVALCNRCHRAWRCDRDALLEIEARHVVATTAEPTLWLPVWSDGAVAAPAFLSTRPLMLARLLSRAASSWPQRETLGGALPLGARLLPESLVGFSRVADLPEPTGRIALLAIPARSDGVRVWLPGETFSLYGDDVVERAELLNAVAVKSAR
ncbi:MAG: hypothetical protein U0V87_16475 [Acidobacteriota bacterium]